MTYWYLLHPSCLLSLFWSPVRSLRCGRGRQQRPECMQMWVCAYESKTLGERPRTQRRENVSPGTESICRKLQTWDHGHFRVRNSVCKRFWQNVWLWCVCTRDSEYVRVNKARMNKCHRVALYVWPSVCMKEQRRNISKRNEEKKIYKCDWDSFHKKKFVYIWCNFSVTTLNVNSMPLTRN